MKGRVPCSIVSRVLKFEWHYIIMCRTRPRLTMPSGETANCSVKKRSILAMARSSIVSLLEVFKSSNARWNACSIMFATVANMLVMHCWCHRQKHFLLVVGWMGKMIVVSSQCLHLCSNFYWGWK